VAGSFVARGKRPRRGEAADRQLGHHGFRAAGDHHVGLAVADRFPCSPMQCVEVVHAVAMARFGPLAPTSIDSRPAIMLMMLPGMKTAKCGAVRFA